MSANNNTKLISNEEETFIDIEKGLANNNNNIIHEIKCILKKTNSTESDNKIKSIILQLISILFVIIFISPFVICDLVFGYKDDSCVDIYPENMGYINMKIYLLASGYFTLGILSSILINWYFVASSIIEDNIVFLGFLSVLLHLSQVFLVIWNILGAVIFWGTLNKQNLCSNNVNTYLFVSLIIKLFANFCNIMATKNKK
jgi:hypothetical protein